MRTKPSGARATGSDVGTPQAIASTIFVRRCEQNHASEKLSRTGLHFLLDSKSTARYTTGSSTQVTGNPTKPDEMRRPVSSGMRYAPNVRRARGTKKETGYEED